MASLRGDVIFLPASFFSILASVEAEENKPIYVSGNLPVLS